MNSSLDFAPVGSRGELAIERLRRMGIRESEILRYYGEELAARVETEYLRGFRIATDLTGMGKRGEEVEDLIQQGCSHLAVEHFFVKGYKRGLAEWREKHEGSEDH